MARIKKGDTVTVLSGKDKGKSGRVLHLVPEREEALVERINLVKHFERRSQQNQAGGIVEREGAVSLSKLALFCSKCHKSAKVKWIVEKDKVKQRSCRTCGEII